MTARTRPAQPDARRLVLAGLALLLLLRAFSGPAFARPAEPGLIPICAGGRILYVALDGTGGPVFPAGEEQAGRADPCPWAAMAHALAAPAPAALPRAAPHALPRGASAAPTPAHRAPAPYRTRAPPARPA